MRSEWILVDKELPEKGRDVLVVHKDEPTFFEVACFLPHRFKDRSVWLITSANEYLDFDEVVAWMPIPKYNPEGGTQHDD